MQFGRLRGSPENSRAAKIVATSINRLQSECSYLLTLGVVLCNQYFLNRIPTVTLIIGGQTFKSTVPK